jgi:hypothetical protein
LSRHHRVWKKLGRVRWPISIYIFFRGGVGQFGNIYVVDRYSL